MNFVQSFSLLLSSLLLYTCGSPNPSSPTTSEQPQLASLNTEEVEETATSSSSVVNGLDPYWYQGKAEISTYELEQARYNGLHPGQLTLIFVTEDFLTDRQVKNDYYRNPNTTKVLKLNQLRRFTTGIYDYSVMSSVFTPVERQEFPHSLKVTTSSQDWCGHSFGQLNFEEGRTYNWQYRSYFESEGDRDEQVEANWVEDELLNLVRMGPEALPTGPQYVLPPMEFILLNHLNVEGAQADGILAEYSGEPLPDTEELMVYTLDYRDLGRKLEVVFGAAVPHRIELLRIEEQARGRKLTTTARRKATELLPYWELNQAEDRARRASLGLE
ncbi:MAG: hypothetical protein AAF433_20275 [Bacteroidota bacterium]